MIDHLADTYARENRAPRRYGAEAGIALGFACATALFLAIFGDITARTAADRIAAEAMIGSAW
jgi:hypothetical protein